MLVHEVGETGFSPLHAPPSSDKAERDVPLWRKPSVLTLEAILIFSAIAIPFALSLRAPPAIAFGERDWVVMGDLRNLTGEASLDASLETAFRISLEQSRYVNVLPDLKLRDALARMQRPADTGVDRAVASEIALRQGARAVILPTVAEVGGRVRVSAEVIDPHTQTTVYAESADGIGAASALESIDTVTHELRARLGEALAAIDRDSEPLPQVTSGNIEALRAYSLGEAAYSEGRLPDARSLFSEALRLDPEFALAMTGLARVDYREDALDSAKANAERAMALEARLTARDRLYVSAWVATFGDPVTAVARWKLLTDLYPDHLNGVYNLALYQWSLLGRAQDCAATAERIDVPQYPYQPDAVYLRAGCLLMLDRIADAVREFERAAKLGDGGGDAMRAAASSAKSEIARAAA
jgi:putative peptide modification system cyclase